MGIWYEGAAFLSLLQTLVRQAQSIRLALFFFEWGAEDLNVRTLRGALPIRDVRDRDHTVARDGFLQPHKVPKGRLEQARRRGQAPAPAPVRRTDQKVRAGRRSVGRPPQDPRRRRRARRLRPRAPGQELHPQPAVQRRERGGIQGGTHRPAVHQRLVDLVRAHRAHRPSHRQALPRHPPGHRRNRRVRPDRPVQHADLLHGGAPILAVLLQPDGRHR